MPVLSVIIPTFNSAKLIKICLDSLLSQSFTDFEILIIDGISSDKTIETVKEYRDDRIKIFCEKDLGIYDAMNKGIRLATANWLYFLGSDDELSDKNVFKKVFEDNIDLVEKSDYVYANVLWGAKEIVYNGRYDLYELYNDNICHQAVFVRKKVFTSSGLFNLKYKVVADWEFNIRCFLSKDIIVNYLNIIVAKYSLQGTSANSKDDLFTKDKNKIFFQYLPMLPLHKQIKFKALYWKSQRPTDKVSIFFYNLIYRIISAVRILLAGRAG